MLCIGHAFRGYTVHHRSIIIAVALLAGGLVALPASAACALPRAPTKVPDAATATEAEMLAAMQTLQRYDTDVKNYTKCIEFETKQNRLNRRVQERLDKLAVEGLKDVAAQFNEQVRLFMAKGSGGAPVPTAGIEQTSAVRQVRGNPVHSPALVK